MNILKNISNSRIHEVGVGILDSYVKVADCAICCVLRPEEIKCDIPFKQTEPYTAMQKLYGGKLLVKVNDQILLFICAAEHSVEELLDVLQVINTMDESGQFSTYSLKTAIVDGRYDIFYNTNITTIRTGGSTLKPICWKGTGKISTQHVATMSCGVESSDLEETMRDVKELELQTAADTYDIYVNYNSTADFIVSRIRTAFNGNVSMARVLENVAACIALEFNDKLNFDGLDNFLLDEVAEFFVTGSKKEEKVKEQEIPERKKETKVYSGNSVLDRVINEAMDN